MIPFIQNSKLSTSITMLSRGLHIYSKAVKKRQKWISTKFSIVVSPDGNGWGCNGRRMQTGGTGRNGVHDNLFLNLDSDYIGVRFTFSLYLLFALYILLYVWDISSLKK